MAKPKLSVIIPVAPWENPRRVVGSLKRTDFQKGQLEEFLIYGTQPSKQRNEGIKRAKGEIILFLDNDSEIMQEYMKKLIEHHKKYDIVGGPAETIPYEGFLGTCFGYVLGSYFGTQKMSARYRGAGKIRETNEKELILCNLSIKRGVLEKHGAFNEKLYPNEENELLVRLQSKGVKALYDPNLKVYRKQRKNLYRFAKQLFNYGRGRMEQFLVKPKFIKTFFFIPSIFVIYLLSLLFYNPSWYLFPLVLYIGVDLIASLSIAIKEKDFKALFVVPLLFPLVHISYGIGIFKGLLFKRKRKEGGKIRIEKIK